MSLRDDLLAALTDEELAAKSEAELWTILHADDLTETLDGIGDEERERLRYVWDWWRRPSQSVPAGMGLTFRLWLVRAGRGFGKTRTGAETTREMTEIHSRIALVGPTAADVRDVMVEGESGIMECFPPDQRPDYEPSKRKITFHNGCKAFCYSAEEPERLRGPQHGWAWGDEPASWRFGEAAVDNLRLGLRLGRGPWALLTGTPKPTPWLRAISEEPTCVTTTGSTYENAHNLAEGFIADILGRYEGTRLGLQEIHAMWLDDVEGALWTVAVLDRNRIGRFHRGNPWRSLNEWLSARGFAALLDRRPWRIVVAVDPPGSTAECGIVVGAAPVGAIQGRDHLFILDDASMRGTPEEWGAQVSATARKWAGANGQPAKVFVEDNQGGDMTRATIHAADPDIPVEKIHAADSKKARAEPVSALDGGGWIHHFGFFPVLESQMVTWVPGQGKSPDRVDARVHVVRALLTVLEVPPGRVMSPNRARRATAGAGQSPRRR